MVRWSSLLATWEKAGLFSYAGRANEAEARFTAGECAVITMGVPLGSGASTNLLKVHQVT